MISTNKSNVLNKERIEFFQSTDNSDLGAKHNYYCLAPELRTMHLLLGQSSDGGAEPRNHTVHPG
jgi:hypothetical protein